MTTESEQSSELAAEKSAEKSATKEPGAPSTRAVGRPTVIHEGLATQLPDIDPEETQDWIDSFDAMLDDRGRERARAAAA